MKILLLSDDGDSLPIAWRLVREGHKCKVFVRNPKKRSIGSGLFERIATFRPEIPWADLIIIDSQNIGHCRNSVEIFGKPSIGPGALLKSLNSSLEKMQELLKKAYIPFAAFSGEEKRAIHISTFYNGRSFLKPLIFSVIYKKLLADDLGPTVPASGCLSFPVVSQKFISLFNRIEPFLLLSKVDYRGPVSIQITERCEVQRIIFGFVPGLLYSIIELQKGSLFDTLYNVALGIQKDLDIGDNYCTSALMSQYPYPIDRGSVRTSMINGLVEENLKHIHPIGMQKLSKEFVACSEDMRVLWASAIGQNVSQSLARLKRTLSNISFPDMQYRKDFSAESDLIMKFQKEGFIDGRL